MLKLTKRADYGMMAMHYLAEHANEGKTHSARDIAAAYQIPLAVLAKTLQTLARAELVSSQYGATGGYALARPAKAITAFDVISAFDGPPVITRCTSVHGTCEMLGHCRVQKPLQRVNDSIRTLLSNITVADLAEADHSPKAPAAHRLVSPRY